MLEEVVAALREWAGDVAWHRKDVLALLECMGSSVERATALGCLGNDDDVGQASDEAVALEEAPAAKAVAISCQVLRDHCPTLSNDFTRKRSMIGRIDPWQAIAQYSDRGAAHCHAGLVRNAVDPEGQPTDDDHPLAGQLAGELLSHLPAVARGSARPNDRHAGAALLGQCAEVVNLLRWLGNVAEWIEVLVGLWCGVIDLLHDLC